MGEVVLFMDETVSKLSISRCRICHEEESESFFEAPCACSGTVKFAHRDCIQRWCDEKGNTTCEICLQVYRHGYTTIPKPSKLIEAAVTIGDSLQIARRENGGRRSRRRTVDTIETDLTECNSAANRGATFCRSLTFTLSVFLLIKHTLEAIYGTEKYPFSICTVVTVKAIGILLPMFIIIRTISLIQKSLRRHQYHQESDEEDTLSSDNEEEHDDDEEQQQHLA